jgi:hypothetical protein
VIDEEIAMLKPLTDRQKTLIVNNVVSACKDINKLNKTGYNFLYLASGFIAHYNLHGFKAFYSDNTLRQEILLNLKQNMWTNFTPRDRDFDYYMSKADVYRRIVEQIQ